MEFVKCELTLEPDSNHQTDYHAEGESENVEERIFFLTKQNAESSDEVILFHRTYCLPKSMPKNNGRIALKKKNLLNSRSEIEQSRSQAGKKSM